MNLSFIISLPRLTESGPNTFKNSRLGWKFPQKCLGAMPLVSAGPTLQLNTRKVCSKN